jgi:hypothetical protein
VPRGAVPVKIYFRRRREMAVSVSSSSLALNDDIAGLAPFYRKRASFVQFYDSDEFLLDVKAPFIGDSLLAGDAAIVIAINWQHDLFINRLQNSNIDPKQTMHRRALCLSLRISHIKRLMKCCGRLNLFCAGLSPINRRRERALVSTRVAILACCTVVGNRLMRILARS